MIKVFAPYLTVDIFADWFSATQQEFSSCAELDQVLAQDIKIACLPIFFDKHISIDHSQFDLILISDIEFNHISVIEEWLTVNGIVNYLLAVGGLENYTVSGNTIYRPWWAFNLLKKNQYQHTAALNKPYDFDILLGLKKPHRDFIMAHVQSSTLLNTSIINYRECFNLFDVAEDEQINIEVNNRLGNTPVLYPYVSNNLDSTWEVSDNITHNVSDQAPWGIYKHTKYSVVPETYYERVFFFSEKITKVMFAKRVFVVFSSQNYLKGLHDLGFKTFDGIIDETYDTIEDNVLRFTLAFEQMQQLAKLDYATIIKQTDSITEHNYQRLITLELEIKTKMQDMIYNKIRNLKC